MYETSFVSEMQYFPLSVVYLYSAIPPDAIICSHVLYSALKIWQMEVRKVAQFMQDCKPHV